MNEKKVKVGLNATGIVGIVFTIIGVFFFSIRDCNGNRLKK